MDHTLIAAPDAIRRAAVTCPPGFTDAQQANIGSNSPRFSSHLKPRACQPPLFTVISENKRYTWQKSPEWMKHPLCSLPGVKPWCFLPFLLLLSLTLNQSLNPREWCSDWMNQSPQPSDFLLGNSSQILPPLQLLSDHQTHTWTPRIIASLGFTPPNSDTTSPFQFTRSLLWSC